MSTFSGGNIQRAFSSQHSPCSLPDDESSKVCASMKLRGSNGNGRSGYYEEEAVWRASAPNVAHL
jgi:hypothetical protein